jgi:hypothetical protein
LFLFALKLLFPIDYSFFFPFSFLIM